mmetsp:Transcript_13344/g.35618  ORF Transcript_13344/g.35618 Transcript_13344/m.35618 type:complete len:529 (+) Transcript_13344:460-2046(+)|eukprot:CAMPEP_0185206840 /NCGR_PEP_ID=MMETSP1140-20130426/59145_1 /TAXON_ID=298111 /ORGANISM="Pavlova sp., Strain CCMP459" /LENGTH=528 /DNA_ID=CAMNT_0027774497 /DNA_START=443 /DNA_END=2029 /DNA_ORIENTATION=+
MYASAAVRPETATGDLVILDHADDAEEDRLLLEAFRGSLETALVTAATRGDHEGVQRLLPSQETRSIAAALDAAAGKGSIDVVRLLLEHLDKRRSDTLPEEDLERTISRALDRGHHEIVSLMLESGTAGNGADCAALDKALKRGQVGTVQYILRSTPTGARSLVAARERVFGFVGEVSHNREELARVLLAHGAVQDLGAALTTAVEHDHHGVAQALLDAGAVPTLSHVAKAAKSGSGDMACLLLDAGAPVAPSGTPPPLRATDDEEAGDSSESNFPLHVAAASAGRRYERTVQMLVNRGADPCVVNARGRTALHTAAAHGSTGVARLLLNPSSRHSSKCPGSSQTKVGAPPGAMQGSVDVNSMDADGRTALLHAVRAMDPANSARKRAAAKEIVDMLLEYRADVNCAAADGTTPLVQAARNGNADVARTLVAQGADVEHKMPGGATPLLVAVAQGTSPDFVGFLLQHRASMEHQDDRGVNALMRAAGHAFTRPRMAILRLLVDHGAIVALAMARLEALEHDRCLKQDS